MSGYFNINKYAETVTERGWGWSQVDKNNHDLDIVNSMQFRPSENKCSSKYRNLYGEIYKEFIGNDKKQFNK